ncbi:MAG: hypothetical protein WC917_04780, partial [Bacilli bacterium]
MSLKYIMAKKVLAKIKNKKISKSSFLVWFFVLGFVLMIIPLANQAAVEVGAGNWKFIFGDDDGILSSEGIAIGETSAKLDVESGFLSGFLQTGLISPSETTTAWQSIILDIDLPFFTEAVFN